MNDHLLDIGVADDLADWWWKDQDELAWAVARGRYTNEEADAIRAHGRDAVARMHERAFPFHEDWTDLVPEPSWRTPALLAGWDRIDLGEMAPPSALE